MHSRQTRPRRVSFYDGHTEHNRPVLGVNSGIASDRISPHKQGMHRLISALVWGLVALFSSIGSLYGRTPNVILIMADDVSWECFGTYGGEDYETPRIDQLAREGIRFGHCYSTPICTPSRVKLMTGQYNFRNYTHFGFLDPTQKTFGHLMQTAGYRTAIAGKWQLNGLYNTLPGSDDPSRPLKAGFHESLLWQVTKGKGNANGGGERFWSPPLEHNGRMITRAENHGKYGPDLFTDFICDFVERNRAEPFFVYYPMVLVHDPFVRTPDTLGDQPLAGANKAPKDPAERKANFVAMVAYMDKLVGRIVDHVDALGLAEETIILFTADNGTNRSLQSQWKGRQIRGGKGRMTDMGTHVPFVARWKGQTQGRVSQDLIEFTDFYATLHHVAGLSVSPDDPIDGRSFLPQLMGQAGRPRDWVLSHYQPYWGQQPGQFARNQEYKLYRDGRFFHVPADLEEVRDLAESRPPKAAQAYAMLDLLLQQAPPAHTEKGSRNTVDRPIYPDWRPMLDPND